MKYTAVDAPEKEAILIHLKEVLPDFHNIGLNLKMPIAEKDKTYAAWVKTKGKKVTVVGNYASAGKRLAFTFSMLGLGIIPPLIWFFTARNPGFKKVEKEIVEALQLKWPAA